MGKRAFLSEFDTAQILRRYSAVTVMGLLREVARCSDSARLDWNVVVKKLNTGIRSAKECQALWRHIVYRKGLADYYPDDEEPSDDESDLEFELLPTPAVSSEANADAVRWVKSDMLQFNIPLGGKKKGEAKSKSRNVAVVDSNQGLSSGGRDGSDKAAANGIGVTAGDSGTASPPPSTACQTSLANPECTLSKAALGQSERKKRKLWSLEEDQELIAAVQKFGEGNWTNILKGSFTHERTAAQLSQRWALIRKRRDIQAAASKPRSAVPTEQGNGVQTPDADPGLRTTAAQNGGSSAGMSSIVPPTTIVENGGVDDAVAPSTTAASIPSSSGCHSQDHASSPPTTSLNNGVNGAPTGPPGVSAGMDSISLKGVVGTSIRATTNAGQRQALANGVGRSTAGSSTAVTAMAVGQARSTSAKGAGASAGAGRLIFPGPVGMSAAAAQAASVGQAATPSTAGALTPGPSKYTVRSNSGVTGGRGCSSKAMGGPDPGVQAAAVAAGARIAPASTLLKGAHSGNVVHIRQGGVQVTKGLQGQTGMNGGGGSRGTSGAIVHYMTTGGSGTPSTLLSAQRPAQQTKNQAAKASSIAQTTSSATPGDSVSPTTSNPTPSK